MELIRMDNLIGSIWIDSPEIMKVKVNKDLYIAKKLYNKKSDKSPDYMLLKPHSKKKQ